MFLRASGPFQDIRVDPRFLAFAKDVRSEPLQSKRSLVGLTLRSFRQLHCAPAALLGPVQYFRSAVSSLPLPATARLHDRGGEIGKSAQNPDASASAVAGGGVLRPRLSPPV
jgi:hypothetical protein